MFTPFLTGFNFSQMTALAPTESVFAHGQADADVGRESGGGATAHPWCTLHAAQAEEPVQFR